MGNFQDTDNAVQKMEYDALNGEIKRTMRRSARDMVQIGYLLKTMMDKMMWQAYYSCFDEYLKSELQMDYTMATRFIKACEKYSAKGNGMEIEEKYEGYSQAVLIEMLNMPPELEEKIAPSMTVKQVREIKRQAKQKDKPLKESEEPADGDIVIDGEYREIDIPESENIVPEKVATSQQEEKTGGEDVEKMEDDEDQEETDQADNGPAEDGRDAGEPGDDEDGAGGMDGEGGEEPDIIDMGKCSLADIVTGIPAPAQEELAAAKERQMAAGIPECGAGIQVYRRR